MAGWIDWIKNIVNYKKAVDDLELNTSLEQLKITLALVLENHDDLNSALLVNQALQGTMPDFAGVPSQPPGEKPGGGDILLTPGSAPIIDWPGVREQTENIMNYTSNIEKTLGALSVVCETFSLGQIDQVLDNFRAIIDRDYQVSLGRDLMKIKAEEWTGEQVRQYWRREAAMAIPDEKELIEMQAKGLLTDEELTESLARLGYHSEWAKTMKENALIHADLSTLEELVRKQIITIDEFKERAKKIGYESASIDLISQIIEPMHSTSSLIDFVVKEVIKPEDFTAAMKRQGWPAEEAQKYWDAHWRLVSLDDLKEMRNREYISDEVYKAELIKHDYPPEWADEIVKLSYRRPTLAQLRQLVEYTEFTDEEIEKVIKDLGFEESWIPLMRKYLLSRRLMLERTQLITELENQFIKGYMTKETFKDELVGLGFSLDVIDMRLKKAQLRDDRERADDLKDIYVKAYRNDYITIEELATSLTELGLREDVVSNIVALETVRKKPSSS